MEHMTRVNRKEINFTRLCCSASSSHSPQKASDNDEETGLALARGSALNIRHYSGNCAWHEANLSRYGGSHTRDNFKRKSSEGEGLTGWMIRRRRKVECVFPGCSSGSKHVVVVVVVTSVSENKPAHLRWAV